MKFKNSATLGLLGIIIISILVSCSAHKNSFKSKGEVLSMTIIEDTVIRNEQLLAQNTTRGFGITADILGKAVSLVCTGVKKLIEIDSKKYSAEYNAGLTNMYFYHSPSSKGPIDPSSMQFDGFKLLRTVDNKGVTDTAFLMTFSVDKSNPYDIINNSMFRLKLDNIVFDLAKAKVPGYRWYFPWTAFYRKPAKNKVDMDVIITITCTWINEQQQMFKDVEMGKFYLTLRDMPIDKRAPGYKEYFENLKGTTLSGSSFLPIRSYGYYPDAMHKLNKCWGQGIYSVWVNFKETGNEHMYMKLLRDNSGTIIDAAEQKLKPAE